MSRLFLVRHGQASFDAEDYDQLSELGARQCRRLAEHWAALGRPVHWVASGRLRRQQESARAFQQARGADPDDVRVIEGLEEYDHRRLIAAYLDQSGEELPPAGDRPAFHRLLARTLTAWTAGRLGGIAPYADFRRGCAAALAVLLGQLDRGENGLVFASAGSVAAALQPVLGLGDAEAMQLKLNFYNSSVSCLLYDGRQATLECLNVISHLEQPGHQHLVTHR